MEVYPSLSSSHFNTNTNTRKRPRLATDDFESHYLKKRLISNLQHQNNAPHYNNNSSNDKTPNSTQNAYNKDEDIYSHEENTPETMDDVKDSHIQLFDINGTMLPLEQKPGQSDYSIPDFILQDTYNDDTGKQLILYQKNPLLPEHDFDNDSVTSEENDQEFESMDID